MQESYLLLVDVCDEPHLIAISNDIRLGLVDRLHSQGVPQDWAFCLSSCNSIGLFTQNSLIDIEGDDPFSH